MATQKAKKAQDKPYIQFSKRLTTFIMIFWGVIRTCSVIAVWLNPQAGESMANVVRGVDDIAMCIVLAYTGNSISEKIALGYFKMRAAENDNEEEEKKDKQESSNG